jgi:hypothetical protein
VPEPRISEVEVAIRNWKMHKLPGADHIQAELIQTGGHCILRSTNHCCQLYAKFYQTFFSLGQFHMRTKLLGITNAAFDVIGQRLVRFSISVRY